ncbi:arylamine N-acetyltransferase [Nocardiopsis sp. Huas11]|uniref:arylamine N-acetyltransferase n=1 Tax=Nocardiopsis sp. Huas11 TaxID=2183912 RepID=UPI000EAD1F67|nr:arylamine N-acetyltransferase [Nocardiopsis sp. Huas11]
MTHYLTSHPRSPFRGRLMVQSMAPDVQRRLMDTTLTTTRPDGAREEREIGIEDVPDVLEEVFGIGLNERERGLVVDSLKADGTV